ncbi:hypothetical protein RF55_12073 [Lasius niger]|uniref:Uncharacterized protein n=1 Tax=Lasius niger TaxID=67767 RepID=A0A0J7KE04_LASNI|nr:hypothetical protein RF55_14421 [Lasius niger]KMQ88439.1 hypothetical protein RF55_12073 [Lasius niger]
MPVHHQGEEFHEPIDGVRPIDYPEIYGYIMQLKCVMALENPIYQNIIDLHKICNSCYNMTSNEQKDLYEIISPHNPVHEDSVNDQIDCTLCNKHIVKIGPAHECRECIGKYLDDLWGGIVLNQWVE